MTRNKRRHSRATAPTKKIPIAKKIREENEILEDLRLLCRTDEYIHVLCYLSFKDNFIIFRDHLRPEDITTSYGHDRTIRTELATLIGLSLQSPISFDEISDEAILSLASTTLKLLSEFHQSFNKPMLQFLENQSQSSIRDMKNIASPFSRGDMLREPIFYGGESAYNFQYLDLAALRYSSDDTWLYQSKGFRTQDARHILEAISKIQSRKLTRFTNTSSSAKDFAKLYGCFSVRTEELSQITKLPASICEAMLLSFTCPPPPTNQEFVTISDFNLANAFPIIKTSNNEFLIIQHYNLCESFYDSPFYWMAADASYKNIAFRNRGTFTEDFVFSRLSKVFGIDYTFQNVNIYRGLDRYAEADILIVFGDRAIIVQCKSKKLTLEARKGNDLQIKNDFAKAVQDSYDQGFRCATSIDDSNLKFLDKNQKTISMPNIKEIYIICVVSDHYPALLFQVKEFLSSNSSAKIFPPLVCDVFMIDIMSEFLHSPLRMLSYINRRVHFHDKILSTNEIAILGYHLKQNLWINSRTDLVVISDDMSTDLDAAMTVRRQRATGNATPDGILLKFEGTLIGKILKSIEDRPDAALLDFGFMILRLSSNAVEDLDIRLQKIAKDTRVDGHHHDFSVLYSEGKTGITVHCNNYQDDTAMDRLSAHSAFRKYASRAESWFGLVVRPLDGLPRLGLTLIYPWQYDAALDKAAKTSPLRGNKFTAKKVHPQPKYGRNSPCNCGSGKKYQYCCL